MKTILQISELITQEVLRAKETWGSSFDEKNTLNDWAAYINVYLGRATSMGASSEEIKRNLRKTAGLALSALYYAENDMLAPRHYEGQPRPLSKPEIKA